MRTAVFAATLICSTFPPSACRESWRFPDASWESRRCVAILAGTNFFPFARCAMWRARRCPRPGNKDSRARAGQGLVVGQFEFLTAIVTTKKIQTDPLPRAHRNCRKLRHTVDYLAWPGSVIGLTRRPLKAETTGSIPVRATRLDFAAITQNQGFRKYNPRAVFSGIFPLGFFNLQPKWTAAAANF